MAAINIPRQLSMDPAWRPHPALIAWMNLVSGGSGGTVGGSTIFGQSAISTVTNSVAELTCLGVGAGSLTLPSNSLLAGSSLRFSLRGTTLRTGAPSLRIRAKLAGLTVADTGLFANIENGAGISIDAMMTCYTSGIAGTLIGQVSALYRTVGLTTAQYAMSVTTGTVAVDTTIANLMDITAQWNAASALNVLSITNACIELLSP